MLFLWNNILSEIPKFIQSLQKANLPQLIEVIQFRLDENQFCHKIIRIKYLQNSQSSIYSIHTMSHNEKKPYYVKSNILAAQNEYFSQIKETSQFFEKFDKNGQQIDLMPPQMIFYQEQPGNFFSQPKFILPDHNVNKQDLSTDLQDFAFEQSQIHFQSPQISSQQYMRYPLVNQIFKVKKMNKTKKLKKNNNVPKAIITSFTHRFSNTNNHNFPQLNILYANQPHLYQKLKGKIKQLKGKINKYYFSSNHLVEIFDDSLQCIDEIERSFRRLNRQVMRMIIRKYSVKQIIENNKIKKTKRSRTINKESISSMQIRKKQPHKEISNKSNDLSMQKAEGSEEEYQNDVCGYTHKLSRLIAFKCFALRCQAGKLASRLQSK